MKLLRADLDKQNRPVAVVEISSEEIAAIKKAVERHPKFKATDNEGNRFRALFNKTPEEYRQLSDINIKDIKEAINKYIQDVGDDSLFGSMRDTFHEIWKTFNPS